MDSAKFWAKVYSIPAPINRPELGPCWLWTSYVNHDGYGRIKTGGKNRFVYHITWEQENGPVPTGLELDHLCRIRACVRPSHLEAVTHAVQMARAVFEQNANREKDCCPIGHPYDEVNTYHRPDRTGRLCKQCRTAVSSKRAKAAREARHERGLQRESRGGGFKRP